MPDPRAETTWSRDLVSTNGRRCELVNSVPTGGARLAIAIVPITNHPLSVPAPAPPSSHPAAPQGVTVEQVDKKLDDKEEDKVDLEEQVEDGSLHGAVGGVPAQFPGQ